MASKVEPKVAVARIRSGKQGWIGRISVRSVVNKHLHKAAGIKNLGAPARRVWQNRAANRGIAAILNGKFATRAKRANPCAVNGCNYAKTGKDTGYRVDELGKRRSRAAEVKR